MSRLKRAVALALLLADHESPAADLVGEEVWTSLVEAGMVTHLTAYPGGEPQPVLTPDGIALLEAMLR